MSGRILRAVVFLALAVLVTNAAEAKGSKSRGKPAEVRQSSALSTAWSWLASSFGLAGIATFGESPGDTTDRGVEFDPNGGPTLPVPSSMPRS